MWATASYTLEDISTQVQNLKMITAPYMEIAMKEAVEAAERGEVPVGAVIVDAVRGEVLSRAGNCIIANNDPTAHAEIIAIRKATSILASPRLEKR